MPSSKKPTYSKAPPKLSPSIYSAEATVTILPSTGTVGTGPDGSGNGDNYAFGIYTSGSLIDTNFMSGASDQVAYTFRRIGGDVLDIELTIASVYSAYEEACLEYSYQINIHQAKNVLSDLLGYSTGTFDHDGQFTGGDASGSAVNLSYPRFEFRHARRVGDGFAEEFGLGGNATIYSASFGISASVQDYDLQTIISSSAITNSDAATGQPVPYAGLVNTTGHQNKKVRIDRVYYRTPQSMWRFYGYYGGLNVVGNLNYYGQFSDDTTFEVIPAWHNKLQAAAYEDHLWTRLSHFSYEIKNNKLRIFPLPDGHVKYMWFDFTIENDPWTEDSDRKYGVTGINNMNTLPFDNIPYKNINAIGKHWIRRYALALSTSTLASIRGKFTTLPIPGDSVSLNAGDLSTQASADMQALKEELKGILDEMTYRALAEKDAAMVTAVDTIQQEIPLMIYQG